MTNRSPATRSAGCSTRSRTSRSDLALADLSSDAFRKQFSQRGRDVDRQDGALVAVSGPGAVHHAGHTGRKPRPTAPKTQEQAVAQILAQDNEVLVCSYLLRTRAAQY